MPSASCHLPHAICLTSYAVSCHTSLHLILVTSAVSCCPFRYHHCLHAISLLNLPGVPWFTLLPLLLKSTPCCRLGVQFANGRSVDPSSSCLIFTAITDSFLADTQLLYTVSDSNSIRIEVYCLTLSWIHLQHSTGSVVHHHLTALLQLLDSRCAISWFMVNCLASV